MTLTVDEQNERRDWFRDHWQNGVRFNQLCKLAITRWDPDGVVMTLPFADELSAHDGVFHGGVIAALIDTCGTGAAMAGHDYSFGSRAATIGMNVQYLSVAPGEDAVATAYCTRRGRALQFATVAVHSASGKLIAQGMVTVSIAGERRGSPGDSVSGG